ncbi:prepilin-type N-terminal cleavage/methylation domain-containing protein, partial [candidate division KSB3 bacterium]|nr:prepilin-type N-terminal cleavage/methylation domain-containing protein [candidate division KSB3 bacterium]MBD3323415.1 prepilin-type N-terminal cleavage/methylation domain-containing protein [candidate division KSB3 bacterium]
MHAQTSQRGVTLVELLVTIVVLSLILAGVYGLLDSVHRMYLNTRALTESQQTARVVVNYLTYRLREMDGGGSGNLGRDPRRCTDCHIPDLDESSTDDSGIACDLDVLIPRRNLYLDNLSTLPTSELPALSGIDAMYTDLGPNYIMFWADLLPAQDISDTFAESETTNGEWDLTDSNGNGKYDEGERELLYLDYDEDGLFDYYGERWTLKLKKPADRNYYELVESLSFENYSGKNNSVYDAYTELPVAYGITGLGIEIIENYTSAGDFALKMGSGGVARRSLSAPGGR